MGSGKRFALSLASAHVDPPPPLSLLPQRHCVRAFLDRPVEPDVLREVLSAAAQAPSTRNTQPWRVAVVAGRAREELSRLLCDAYDSGVPASPDYPNRVDWHR